MTRSAPEGSDVPALRELSRGPVLLYDGSCGVCNATVQWILNAERGRWSRTGDPKLRFAALESPLGLELRERIGVPENTDSVLWIRAQSRETPEYFAHSSAIVQVLRYLGGFYSALGLLLVLVPWFLRDGAYRLFARHRTRFVPPACFVPDATERPRFLAKISS